MGRRWSGNRAAPHHEANGRSDSRPVGSDWANQSGRDRHVRAGYKYPSPHPRFHPADAAPASARPIPARLPILCPLLLPVSQRHNSYLPPKDVWILSDLGRPIVLMSKANHDATTVLQALCGISITLLPLRVVVIVSINVDIGLVIFIVEIWPRATRRGQVLRMRWQAVPTLLQRAQPATLEFRIGLLPQLLEMLRT